MFLMKIKISFKPNSGLSIHYIHQFFYLFFLYTFVMCIFNFFIAGRTLDIYTYKTNAALQSTDEL